MRPPNYLVRAGIDELYCIGDGRQSSTSGSPSILNASPEAAAGGNLALLQTYDGLRIGLAGGRVDVLLVEGEMERRRIELDEAGGFRFPPSQTPWQAMQRRDVGQLGTGAILEGAERFHKIDRTFGVPRDSH